MIRSRFQRSAVMLGASSLVLAMAATGIATGSANASTSVPGVTSSSVTIGATVPLSGIASSYAEVSAAALAVFKYINKKGGVNGRTINFIRLDDCYNLASQAGLGCTQPSSTTTLSQTQTLVDSDHVFATVGSLGTAAQDSVLNFLKQNKVPQLFVNSGSSDWNQASKYPDLFGFQASYKVEGKIFGTYINAHFKGQKVGFVGQDDDFGTNGYIGLTEGKPGTDAVSVASNDKFLYSPANALFEIGDITPAVTKMKNDGVKVVVLDSIPAVTARVLADAHAIGFAPQWVISTVGSDPISVNTSLESGAISTDGLPATSDTSNVWNVWLKKVLLADSTDFPHFTSGTTLDGNEQYGAAYAVAFAEALYSLGKNGVTQAGIVKAMTTTKFATPTILPLSFSATNHQGLLGGVIASIPTGNPPTTITESSHTVYTTTDAANTAVATSSKYTVSAIPGWLS